jgi:hypothetical protein
LTSDFSQPSLESSLAPEATVELSPEPLVPEVSSAEAVSEAPSAEYQPTADAFNQTVAALDAVKAEGNPLVSSEDLPPASSETA